MSESSELVNAALNNIADAGIPVDRSALSGKRDVVMFGDGTGVGITDAAVALGQCATANGGIYCRKASLKGQGTPQLLSDDLALQPLTGARAASEFERIARLVRHRSGKAKKDAPGDNLISAVCSRHEADLIIQSQAFLNALPPLILVSPCPVLVTRSNDVLDVITGYDGATGIYAGGGELPEMTLAEAVHIIKDGIFGEYRFLTPSDLSAAIANLLGPAFVLGQIAPIRIPFAFVEADLSQSGKGLMNRCTAAVYNNEPHPVSQQKGGGLGSMREKFDSHLIHGRNFISFDNLNEVRGGVFDSEELCQFMTEATYTGRALRQEATVDPRRFVIAMTTNGCTLSQDLANRSNPVHIRKRPNYQFAIYAEGGLDLHIRAHWQRYLAAVYTVIQEWHRQGRQRTATTVHDSAFNPWAQIMDWIVQNLCGCAPLLANHAATRQTMTSPDMMWLRKLALAVKAAGKLGQDLTASALLDVAKAASLEIPGLQQACGEQELTDDEHEKLGKIQVGTAMSRCFGKTGTGSNQVRCEGFEIGRGGQVKKYAYGGVQKTKVLNTYTFAEIGSGGGQGKGPAAPAAYSQASITLNECERPEMETGSSEMTTAKPQLEPGTPKMEPGPEPSQEPGPEPGGTRENGK